MKAPDKIYIQTNAGEAISSKWTTIPFRDFENTEYIRSDSLQQEQTEADLEVSKFCQPVPENIANCVAEHFWEMLDDEEKEDTRTIETAQQEQEVVDLEKEIDRFWDSCIKHKNERGGNVIWSNKIEIEVLARHFYELGLRARKEE